MKRTIALLGGSAAALALVASGCGNSSSAQSPSTTAAGSASTVDTKLSEFKIGTSSAQAKAGKVTFSATNDGKTTHELIVIKTDKRAGDLGTGPRVSEAGSVGEVADVAPGKTKSTTLDLQPGHYALICNVNGHYMAGMHTDLTVS